LEAFTRFPELHGYRIIVVADREFASPRLVHWLKDTFGVDAILRCKRSQYIQEEDAPPEQLYDVLHRIQRGEQHFFPSVLLTKQATKPLALCIVWRSDCEEPMILATSLDNPEDTLAHYAQRFGTEPMYKDFKSNGFDIESIDTLMILCAFAMIMLFTMGVDREENKESRTTVKKKNGTPVTKRLRGVFLDGLRWLEQLCKKLSPRLFAATIKDLFQRLWKT
jgi:hypothetical protein